MRRRPQAWLVVLAVLLAVTPASPVTIRSRSDRSDEDGRILIAALKSRCVKCHGAKRAKGGLRLDQVSGILSAVRAGEAPASPLFRRVTLPAGHRDAMPPKGARLDDAARLAMMRWINAGADPAALDLTDEKAPSKEAALAVQLASLGRATGAFVVRESGAGETAMLRIDFSRRASPPGRAAAVALRPVKDRIVALSLAGQELAPGFVDSLPELPALQRLGLQRTGCDDATLGALLERAPGVQRLNLHATSVTAHGLDPVGRLATLRRLVLHDTPIDARHLREFASRHPRVVLTGTLGLPAAPFPAGGPRRLLIADASKNREVLVRETALGHLELLWERPRGKEGGTGEAFGARPTGTDRGPAGSTLLCARDGREVLEMTREGRVGFRLSPEDLERIGIGAVSDLQVLPSGNLVLAARDAGAKGPHLVEVTREKKVVLRIHAPRLLGSRLQRVRVFEDPRRND